MSLYTIDIFIGLSNFDKSVANKMSLKERSFIHQVVIKGPLLSRVRRII